ncbi:MAG: flagellar basal body protein [Planctomycetota bacterium]
MIKSVTNGGAVDVLERLMQFAGQRHRIITNNIANISTPGYRMQDVSVKGFQAQLQEAIDARRNDPATVDGPLELRETTQVRAEKDRLDLRPEPIGTNILFHDQNDRDPERLVQSLVENFVAFRTAAQFLRKEYQLINMAITERP